jgi:hypothetical protein
MNFAYIRATKAGPPEDEQRAACVAAGVDPANADAWYVEPVPKRNRAASFEERDLAVRQLRPGDRLVIHSAPRLGATEAEIRGAAAAVSALGAVIYDCAAAAEIRHHPDAGRLLEWAKAGALLAAQERLGKARQGITRRHTPAKALTGKALAQAREAFETRAQTGASVATIAERFGVSPSTLHREARAGKWRRSQ